MSTITLRRSNEKDSIVDKLQNEPVLDVELKNLDFAYKSRKKHSLYWRTYP